MQGIETFFKKIESEDSRIWAMEKSLRDGSQGALNPATEKIKTLDSHNVVSITGCSGGLFCLAVCLLNRGEFLMDVSQCSVCAWCMFEEKQLSVFICCV